MLTSVTGYRGTLEPSGTPAMDLFAKIVDSI